jgi:hypothetical protein
MTAVTKGTGAARQACLYYSVAFKTGLSWVKIARVKGHKLPLGLTESQQKGRDLVAEINIPGWLQVGPLSFQYRHLKGATDSVMTFLRGSYEASVPHYWLEMDCDISLTGGKGNKFPGYVSKLDKSAEDENAIVYDVEVKYCEAYDEDGALVELSAHTT